MDMRSVIDDHDKRLNNLEGPKTSTPMFAMPDKHPYFTGRESHLEWMREQLESPSVDFVGICGLGGVGKTSLILQSAWDSQNIFPGGIYWLTADTGPNDGDATIKDSLFGLLTHLQLVPKESPVSDDMLVDILNGHFNSLKDRFLVIIDNLDYEKFSKAIRKLIKGPWVKQTKSKIVITTRLDENNFPIQEFGSKPILRTLTSFDPEEGVRFLRLRTELVMDELDAREIVMELGGLPLALDQCAAYLRACRTEKLQSYLKKLQERKMKILRKKTALPPSAEVDNSRLAVHSTWSLNMACVEEEHEQATKVMQTLAFMSPRAIPMSVFNPGSPRLSDEGLAVAMEEDVDEIIHALSKLSLFDR